MAPARERMAVGRFLRMRAWARASGEGVKQGPGRRGAAGFASLGLICDEMKEGGGGLREGASKKTLESGPEWECSQACGLHSQAA